jgi:glycosyltransferase involved in cell wall biosynthesis
MSRAASASPRPSPSEPRGGLRICMVLPTLARAGMEIVAARLSTGLVRNGHEVSVACIEESGPIAEQLAAAGVAVDVVPAPGLAANVRAPALVAWFGARRPNVVHTHSGAWLKGARAARAARVRAVVHTVHGLLDREPWYSDFLKRRAAAATSAVVAVSHPLRSHLLSSTRLSPSEVRTIPNGIDTLAFSPELPDSRARLLPGSDGRIVVGCVARFEPVKNHDLLLRAFRDARQTRPELLLVLVGDGTLRLGAEAQARSLGIADEVRFVGDQPDAASWYRCFDAFVLASRAEGTSMSILEAMASGCSIIATDVGGNRALLGEDDAGRLVPSEDAAALAAAMAELGPSPGTAARLASAARQRAERLYSHAVMVERYEALYREVLASDSHD